METLGLIGGIGPQATSIYYSLINQSIQRILGNHSSAKIVIVSMNFEEIVRAINKNHWHKIENLLLDACLNLEKCGVSVIAFCCNTLHKVSPHIIQNLNTPFLHILQPVVTELNKQKIYKVALLGTQFTMREDFHKKYLRSFLSEIEFIEPSSSQIEQVDKIIFNELCHGVITEKAEIIMTNISHDLNTRGADAIILGCTELPLIFEKINLPFPTINTAQLHTQALVELICPSYQLNDTMITCVDNPKPNHYLRRNY